MTISRHDLICTKTIDAQDFPAIARENNVIQLNWNIKRKVIVKLINPLLLGELESNTTAQTQ